MKKLLIAASLLAVGATSAVAQFGPGPGPRPEWRRDAFPYEQRRHSICQEKAWRLHSYERRAAADGRLSWNERRNLSALQNDLDRTCGRFRWRG
jgi:hypothetical protein